MAAEVTKEIRLEIGHVLFIDIVGYSKLLIDKQRSLLDSLNQIVRDTNEFRSAETAGRLIKIPTGDGMALVFYNSPEAPVECAVEISRALKNHPELRLRMGVHSGPVSGMVDVTERANVTGAGINVAQRVMDCGDAGHILLSKHVAEDLEQSGHWQPHLHDLGECEVKHGARLHVVNLYTDELGNSQIPERFKPVAAAVSAARKSPINRKHFLIAAVIIAALAIVALIFAPAILRPRAPSRLEGGAPATPNAGGLAGARPSIPEKSIAVLPFENRSRDSDNAYFADGIQDEILTRLAKIADLKVIPRTSTQRYQSKPANLPEIARQLGVTNILEGSVQKVADQVRVNVQLINAQSDSHIWAETYDRKLSDIFGVESEIAKGIADSLQAKLTGHEKQALAAKPTNNPEAYDAYLRGLALQARIGQSIHLALKTIGYFERAVQLDPNFAIAWAHLSRAHAYLYFQRVDTARPDLAKDALEHAQILEPNSPETLLALGYYQYWVLRDYGLAKATFGLVSKLLPGNSDVAWALSAVNRRLGNWNESLAAVEAGLDLDPRNGELITTSAWTYDMLRQFPVALTRYDQATDIIANDPDLMSLKAGSYQAQGNLEQAANLLSEIAVQTPFENAFFIKMTQLRLERNYAEAIRLLQTRLAQFKFTSEIYRGGTQVYLAIAQRLAGDAAGAKVTAEQARNTLEPLGKKQPENSNFAEWLALAYAELGEKDLALKEAERATMLLPSAKDAVDGPGTEENLALVQTLFGDSSSAIATLMRLVQTPFQSQLYGPMPLTPAYLRLDPLWDSLRADPGFRELYEKTQP